MTTKRSLAWGVLLALATAGFAAAQDTAPDVGFSAVPFNFAPPGARSLAMGGTFIAVADDATASASNPAGLVILTRPEVSAHVRYTKFLEQEALGSEFTAVALESEVWSPAFFSIVIPTKNLSVSFYYQQVANSETARGTAGVVGSPETGQLFVSAGSAINLKLEDVGVSLGFKLGEKASLGATVSYRRMSLTLFNLIDVEQGFFSGITEVDDTKDSTVALNAGLLINPNGRLSAGLVYKYGGEFEMPYGVGISFLGLFEDFTNCPPGLADAPCSAAKVRVPDVFGAGIAFRPSPNFMLSADANLIRYSQLGKTDLRINPLDLFPPQTDVLPPADFDDVVEFHAGAEYTFIGDTPVSLRAGIYNRPDFNKGGTVDTGDTFFTFGGGFVFGGNFQLDLAASLSDQVKEGLASVVVRF